MKRLYCVTTLTIDANIREAATQMEDNKILIKLAAGDMVACEACYHMGCMTNFSNQYRDYVANEIRSNKQLETNDESIALAETMMYIEDTLERNRDEIAPYIQLASMQIL